MRLLPINVRHSQLTDDYKYFAQERCSMVQTLLQSDQAKHFSTPYGFAWLSTDNEALKAIKMAAQEKQALKPDFVVLVGIGGSSLGTRALYEALRHTLPPAPLFYHADTIDPIVTQQLLTIIEMHLQQGAIPLVVLVTKSGTTLETLVNAACILDLIKKYIPQPYSHYVVAITEKDSQLWQWAQQEKIMTLPVAVALSGRFSVFSAVGLFPLALMGIDIDQLCAGALVMQEWCLQTSDPDLNPAVRDALLLYTHYKEGRTIHNTFVFSPVLVGLAHWYSQLLAESIGKRYTVQKEEVNTGIVPITSVATNDLHAQFQLYMGGPDTMVTSFLQASSSPSPVVIPQHPLAGERAGKGIGQIQSAIFAGVIESYVKNKRPFVVYDFLAITPHLLGQWMQLKMLSTVYVAALFNVDAFDQPEVESYKQAARRFAS